VTGRVLDDSTSAPIPAAWVYLFTNCRTTTDELGRFAFANVHGAQARVDLGHDDYRDPTPSMIPVAAAGDTTSVTLRLRPGGPLPDCRVTPICAPLVTAARGALTDEDDFVVTAFAAALAILWPEITPRSQPACVSGSEAIRAAMAARHASSCLRPSAGRSPALRPPRARGATCISRQTATRSRWRFSTFARQRPGAEPHWLWVATSGPSVSSSG
jgi:hypothetical protein